MSPAQFKNLRALVDKRVVIEWKNPADDWPHFTLIDVDHESSTIQLRGEDYPDGNAKHDGDVFWADWSDVKSLKELQQ